MRDSSRKSGASSSLTPVPTLHIELHDFHLGPAPLALELMLQEPKVNAIHVGYSSLVHSRQRTVPHRSGWLFVGRYIGTLGTSPIINVLYPAFWYSYFALFV